MPYIKQEDRVFLDPYVNNLSDAINSNTPAHIETDNEKVMTIVGELNYCITRLCSRTMGQPTYPKIALITGMLENVKQEFYRRLAAPYEENKIVQNGDVREYKNLNIWK
jgi:uncharacterized metal-binding protein YceD (DUF177 family)